MPRARDEGKRGNSAQRAAALRTNANLLAAGAHAFANYGFNSKTLLTSRERPTAAVPRLSHECEKLRAAGSQSQVLTY